MKFAKLVVNRMQLISFVYLCTIIFNLKILQKCTLFRFFARLHNAGDINCNKLSAEKSSYLLQHAHNPVQWFVNI